MLATVSAVVEGRYGEACERTFLFISFRPTFVPHYAFLNITSQSRYIFYIVCWSLFWFYTNFLSPTSLFPHPRFRLALNIICPHALT